VALTFDDGPSQYTGQVLDILQAHGAPATFFVRGVAAERHPELLARMATEGHGIGNHGYRTRGPRGLARLYAAAEADEVARTQQVVETLTGQRPRFFRAPGGGLGRRLWRLVEAEGLEVVYGALPFPDPEEDAAAQLKTARGNLSPGAILILHDGGDRRPGSTRPQALVEMLPHLLAALEADGFRVADLESLLYDERCG